MRRILTLENALRSGGSGWLIAAAANSNALPIVLRVSTSLTLIQTVIVLSCSSRAAYEAALGGSMFTVLQSNIVIISL